MCTQHSPTPWTQSSPRFSQHKWWVILESTTCFHYKPTIVLIPPSFINRDWFKNLNPNQKHFSEARDVDTIARVQGEIDDLKNVMVQNIGTEIKPTIMTIHKTNTDM